MQYKYLQIHHDRFYGWGKELEPYLNDGWKVVGFYETRAWMYCMIEKQDVESGRGE